MADWDLFWSKRTTKERVLNLGGIMFNQAFARHITRHLGPPGSCGPILEVGTGRGVCSITLMKMGYHCVSVDYSEVAVKLARGKGLDTLLCDGRHLPFGQAIFEIAFTQGLLEHLGIDDQVAILKETRRVSRRVVHSVPAKQGVMDFGERIFKRLGKVWPYPDEKKYDKSEFTALLSTTFPDVEVTNFLKVDWIGFCE
jgi:ubiquinone/menaquinone biosynthesis C-methylase UbiE